MSRSMSIMFLLFNMCSISRGAATEFTDVENKPQTTRHRPLIPDVTKKLSLAEKPKVLSQHNVIVRVYTGAVARLRCRLPPREDGNSTVEWYYSPTDLSLQPLQEDETIISEWHLTIYNTRPHHAGAYRCETDGRRGAVVLLEVVDDEEYDVVKPPSSSGPHASQPVPLGAQLLMSSSWSEWSECSRCDAVGRRRRYGICYVTLLEADSSKSKQNASVEEETLKLFRAFPEGIPCRSLALPPTIRHTPTVRTHGNEIMIGLCRVRTFDIPYFDILMVKCEESILKIRSKSGDIIEIVNNTAGVYSLSQRAPPQPPPPPTAIKYVEPGNGLVITCSGTTLRDVPFTWRLDTRELNPRDLDRRSGGRVHLNARDHIVFTAVSYGDAHVYSCWQRGALAGAVRVRVERGAGTACGGRSTLFTAIIVSTMLLRLTMRLVRYRRRYLGIA